MAALNEHQQKYCDCVLDVAAKNSAACNQNHDFGTPGCYNPYAVCAKSTKTSYRHCGENYDWTTLSDEQLRAYAELNNISVPVPFNREQIVNNIYDWKASK